MPDAVQVTTAQIETVLRETHNWHAVSGEKRMGAFVIASGAITADFVAVGQYYRITGSTFNDGLHRMGDGDLTDEVFDGAVTPLKIPKAVTELAGKIAQWREKNPETDKTSESFGGYSYSRGDAAGSGWRAAFAGELRVFRRPYDDC